MTRESLVAGYSGRMLLVVSVGWGLIQTGRLALSPLLPAIIDDLDATPFLAGVALSVMWGLYAVFQYPSGRLSDRGTRKPMLVAGLSMSVVGFSVLAVASTYPVFLLGTAVVGLGGGLFPTVARALVSDLFVERRGAAFGLHTASGDLGGGLAAGLAAVVLAVATWRAAFPPVLTALGLTAVAVHLWNRESYGVGRGAFDVRDTARRLLGSTSNRRLLVVYSLYAFVWQGVASFLPTYLAVGKGFSTGVAGGAFAALFLVGAVVKPAAGELGDRYGRRVVAAVGVAAGGAALLAVILLSAPLAVLVAVGVFAAGLMAFPPVMQAYLMDVFPAASAGGDLGATRTIYIGLGGIGPAYVGFVAEQAGYAAAFAGLLVCLLASGAGLLALSSPDNA